MTPFLKPPIRPGYYSENFSRVEMTASPVAARRGIDNTPSPDAEANMVRLCRDFLEPIRHFAGPVHVNSGYRSSALNAVIGGSARSGHLDGRAADIIPLDHELSLRQLIQWIIRSPLEYDQLIYEYGAWVHIGISATPRRQNLMIYSGTGYLVYNQSDQRVV